jgi:hypothetical protein
MGLLNGSSVYLSGAVEAHSDPNSWRNKLSIELEKIGIRPWNPLVKPKWIPNITAEEQRDWKSKVLAEDPDTDNILFKNARLRHFCLHMVANANFVIMKLDNTQTIGTFEELAVAKYKPVFVLSDNKLPSMWLLAQLGLNNSLATYIHQDIDSLVSILKAIDCGSLKPVPEVRWMFLRYWDERRL